MPLAGAAAALLVCGARTRERARHRIPHLPRLFRLTIGRRGAVGLGCSAGIRRALDPQQSTELIADLANTDEGLCMGRVWRLSSYTNQGHCVEVARDHETAAVRDSKDPHGPHLSFSANSFAQFLRKLNEQ